MKQKWLIGNPDDANWKKKSIAATIIRYYNNMSEDGTLEREFHERDQVIALATREGSLEQDLTIAKTTIALTTSVPAQDTTHARGGKSFLDQNSMQPYSVRWQTRQKGRWDILLV